MNVFETPIFIVSHTRGDLLIILSRKRCYFSHFPNIFGDIEGEIKRCSWSMKYRNFSLIFSQVNYFILFEHKLIVWF